jgi:hypothetical protein
MPASSKQDDYLPFGRSRLTSRNSDGPLMRRRRRVAFSSLLVFGICAPMTSAANSAARSAPCLAVERTRGLLGEVDFDRPISTSRRMASDSDGVSGWFSAHLTIAARIAGSARNPMSGLIPVRGRPMAFDLTVLAFFIFEPLPRSDYEAPTCRQSHVQAAEPEVW